MNSISTPDGEFQCLDYLPFGPYNQLLSYQIAIGLMQKQSDAATVSGDVPGMLRAQGELMSYVLAQAGAVVLGYPDGFGSDLSRAKNETVLMLRKEAGRLLRAEMDKTLTASPLESTPPD